MRSKCMKNLNFKPERISLTIVVVLILFVSCQRGVDHPQLILSPKKVLIDTSDDFGVAILMDVNNQSNRNLAFFTGNSFSSEIKETGFFLSINGVERRLFFRAITNDSAINLKQKQRNKIVLFTFAFITGSAADFQKDLLQTSSHLAETKLDTQKFVQNLRIGYLIDRNYQGENYELVKSQQIILNILPIEYRNISLTNSIMAEDLNLLYHK